MNKITVFCAVWHKDPNRLDLLKNHQQCLDEQTCDIDRIYIFDGGDAPPAWLKGNKISCSDFLTIYEAWNVALINARTPYVMNLNLDDRIKPECCQLYIDALDQGADLVGGEWEICFTQNETNNLYSIKDIDDLSYYPDWPPIANRKVRLGSGTGERGTRGPACAWKIKLHSQIPRYPFKFSDNSPIKVIGDLVWWMALQRLNKNLVRLPIVVGKYHSHPIDQAEFRNPGDDEILKLKKIGISFF